MIEISEREYTLKEAAEILNEDMYNIIYWQKELGIPEKINESNQRIYTSAEINLFRFIKATNDNEALRAFKKYETEKDDASKYYEDMINRNIETSLNRIKSEIVSEIDKTIEKRTMELKLEIEKLKTSIDAINPKENIKINDFTKQWKIKGIKRGFLGSIFR